MDYEDNRQSRFNAGVALAERVDALQRAINASKFNPIAQNFETGTFNFENMTTATDSLMHEAWGKLNKLEKEFCLRIMQLMRDYKKQFPPVKFDKNGNLQVNKMNYEKYLELQYYYERKAKEMLDAHALNAPDSDDDEGL